MGDINTIQEQLTENEIPLGDCTFLYLDVSSTCTGYVVTGLDFLKKKAYIKSAGVIWFNPKWTHQEKYHYLFSAIVNYFWIVENVDYIVHESYAINTNQKQGIMVVPEMIGSVKVAAWENGVRVDDIPPQTWRSQLGIKPNIIQKPGQKAKREYKLPTKIYVEKFMDVPETSISNITNKERKTPSDLYDAVGVCLGWLKKYGFKINKPRDYKFNNHIGIVDG